MNSTTADEQLAAILQLSLTSGVGPRTFKALVEYFGSAREAVEAAPSELRKVAGVGARLVRAIVDARQTLDIPAELKLCRDAGVKLLTEHDDIYPRMLREIYDPPTVAPGPPRPAAPAGRVRQ